MKTFFFFYFMPSCLNTFHRLGRHNPCAWLMWSRKQHGTSTISSALLGTISFQGRSRGIGISTVLTSFVVYSEPGVVHCRSNLLLLLGYDCDSFFQLGKFKYFDTVALLDKLFISFQLLMATSWTEKFSLFGR